MYFYLNTGTSSSLYFAGQADVSEYQDLLLSLTYINTASEPKTGNRSISITVSDGIHQDMTAVIIIVLLRNDNPLTLQAGTVRLSYLEGETSIPAGALSGVVLLDEDRDGSVQQLTLSLVGALESGESLVVDPSSVIPGVGLISDSEISIDVTSSLQNYQVHRAKIGVYFI